MKFKLLFFIIGVSLFSSSWLFSRAEISLVSDLHPNIDVTKSALLKDSIPKTDSIVADFIASDTLITVNETITFTNLSSGGPTFFKWKFPGASPSISYVQNPTVLYHTPGIYNVTLMVSGLLGCDTLIKENYIEVMPEVSGLPPGWEYEETMTKHSIILTLGTNPRIFDTSINTGDYIGVFYMSDGDTLRCGGAVEWNDTASVAIVAQGDNALTPAKDGFSMYEDFTFRIYSSSKQEEYPATPSYDPGIPFHFFLPGVFSVLTDIYAGRIKEISISAGWSAISSPVLPWYAELDSVFKTNLQDLIIISDGEKFYRPQSDSSTLEVWENKGFIVKMSNAISIDFKGYPPGDFSIDIQEGWNLLPVPVDCEVDIATLFQENMDQLVIIKEIAGFKTYWPEHDIYSLTLLTPGKAYAIYAGAGFNIQFSACE